MDDKELERLAVEELLGEAKRGKERSETMGTYGWQKRNITTNKRFLRNTLLGTLPKDQKPTNANGVLSKRTNETASAAGSSKRHSSNDLQHDQYPKKKSIGTYNSESMRKHETTSLSAGTSSSQKSNTKSHRGFLLDLKSDMKTEHKYDKSRTSKVKTIEKS